MRIILYIFLLTTFLSAKVLNISEIQDYKSINHVSYVKDNNFVYQDIIGMNNLPFLEKKYLGNSTGPFWTKLTIKNDTNNFKQLALYNDLSGMNLIDVYLVKNNQLIKTLFLGDFREQSLRDILSRYSSFILELEPNEEITVVSKFENYLIYNLNWEIISPETFFNKETKILFMFGIFGGMLILFLMFNILNGLLYKKIEYFFISGLALSIFSYEYSFNGILYFLDININLQLITAIVWNTTSVGGIFIALFSITFFKLYEKYKIFFYISSTFVVIFFCLVFLVLYAQFIDNYFFSYYWLILLNMIIIIFYLNILAIYMFSKKEVGSTYYLIGSSILLIAILINTIGIIGVVNYDEKMKYLVPSAYIIDVLSMLISLHIRNKVEQKELRRAKMLVLEQSRFSSIGQAIGHISHQWRNPLSKIGTSITLLETVYEHRIEELNETFKNKLPLIKSSIELMKKSIDEFYNFYGVRKKDEEFSPYRCIENILEMLSSKIILKKVIVQLNISPETKIKSFEHIWSNIFLVLIDNSLDAFQNEDKRDIAIFFKEDKDSLKITYIDNAGGIKIKPIESIFEYFISLKENNYGSGIGLTVIKMLIEEKLKGIITVKNYKNGVKFNIIIPKQS